MNNTNIPPDPTNPYAYPDITKGSNGEPAEANNPPPYSPSKNVNDLGQSSLSNISSTPLELDPKRLDIPRPETSKPKNWDKIIKAETYVNASNLLAKKGLGEQQVALLTKALGEAPSEYAWEYFYLRGKQHLEGGNYKEALEDLEKSIYLHSSPQALYLKANTLAMDTLNPNYAKAYQILEQLIEVLGKSRNREDIKDPKNKIYEQSVRDKEVLFTAIRKKFDQEPLKITKGEFEVLEPTYYNEDGETDLESALLSKIKEAYESGSLGVINEDLRQLLDYRLRRNFAVGYTETLQQALKAKPESSIDLKPTQFIPSAPELEIESNLPPYSELSKVSSAGQNALKPLKQKTKFVTTALNQLDPKRFKIERPSPETPSFFASIINIFRWLFGVGTKQHMQLITAEIYAQSSETIEKKGLGEHQVTLLTNSIEAAPSNRKWEYYYLRGKKQLENGNYAEAVKDFNLSIKQKSTHQALYLKANALAMDPNKIEVIESFLILQNLVEELKDLTASKKPWDPMKILYDQCIREKQIILDLIKHVYETNTFAGINNSFIKILEQYYPNVHEKLAEKVKERFDKTGNLVPMSRDALDNLIASRPKSEGKDEIGDMLELYNVKATINEKDLKKNAVYLSNYYKTHVTSDIADKNSGIYKYLVKEKVLDSLIEAKTIASPYEITPDEIAILAKNIMNLPSLTKLLGYHMIGDNNRNIYFILKAGFCDRKTLMMALKFIEKAKNSEDPESKSITRLIFWTNLLNHIISRLDRAIPPVEKESFSKIQIDWNFWVSEKEKAKIISVDYL